MKKRAFLLFFLIISLSAFSADDRYDLVLSGGRVIDPETGLDGIYNVGILADRIAGISKLPLTAVETIDVTGLVVAPGFIDLHNHAPTPVAFRYQALDGVTTSLDLEAGTYPLKVVSAHLGSGSPINYGASAGYFGVRAMAKAGVNVDFASKGNKVSLNNSVFHEPANPDELNRMRRLLIDGLDTGGIGIGLALDYMSEAINQKELEMIFEVAHEYDAPMFIHIRRGIAGDPAGLTEVITLAKDFDVSIHICHLQHSAMKGTEAFLAMIRKARAEGVDITTEMFPYNAGTTVISAAVLDRNWQDVFDISYSDIEWSATGERMTPERWNYYRKNEPTGYVTHHYVKEEWTKAALVEPGVMVVTDAVPLIDESVKVPPQGIGSYSRVLGRYVREIKLLNLTAALAKMSLLPARRLQDIAPRFKRKGRLQVGADADITVFDPATIIDRATYRKPFQASEGVAYLLVNGELVVRKGVFQDQVKPGRFLTSHTE